MLKFTQRTEEQLSQWARIEMPNKGREFGERYYACNRTKKTLEFRAFRGTIKYSRFKATLIFISALHEYLNGKKFDKLEKEKDLWLKFKSFLQYRNQYHFLVKYLESKNI